MHRGNEEKTTKYIYIYIYISIVFLKLLRIELSTKLSGKSFPNLKKKHICVKGPKDLGCSPLLSDLGSSPTGLKVYKGLRYLLGQIWEPLLSR